MTVTGIITLFNMFGNVKLVLSPATLNTYHPLYMLGFFLFLGVLDRNGRTNGRDATGFLSVLSWRSCLQRLAQRYQASENGLKDASYRV